MNIVRREPEPNERVRVHMNLNRGVLAVRSLDTDSPLYNRTLAYTRGPVFMRGCVFVVSENAHAHIVETGARQVCAYIRGRFATEAAQVPGGRSVRYNPFRCAHFTVDGAPAPGLTADAVSARITGEGYVITATDTTGT